MCFRKINLGYYESTKYLNRFVLKGLVGKYFSNIPSPICPIHAVVIFSDFNVTAWIFAIAWIKGSICSFELSVICKSSCTSLNFLSFILKKFSDKSKQRYWNETRSVGSCLPLMFRTGISFVSSSSTSKFVVLKKNSEVF